MTDIVPPTVLQSTAYSVSASHLPTHTKKRRQPKPAAPVVAETVIMLERTPELYARNRAALDLLYGGLEPSSPYYAEQAPAAWLALPPMRVTVTLGTEGN